MRAGRYTYVQVAHADETRWVAGPATKVKVGDRVQLPKGLPMKDFYSEILDRRFDSVNFVGAISVVGLTDESADEGASHPEVHPAQDDSGVSIAVADIAPATNGVTISKIMSDRADFAGKRVVFRAQVTKFLPEIMARNWLHVRDSSESKDADLVVTTDGVAEPGDVVVIEGVVTTNRNFGYGYAYDLLIEEADVKVESEETEEDVAE